MLQALSHLPANLTIAAALRGHPARLIEYAMRQGSEGGGGDGGGGGPRVLRHAGSGAFIVTGAAPGLADSRCRLAASAVDDDGDLSDTDISGR